MFQVFCIICMAPHLRSRSLFCRHCFSKIFPEGYKFKQRLEEGVVHYYLFDWNSKTDLAARAMIYFLKNKKPHVFAELVERFSLDCEWGTAIVPSCSNPNDVNHAASVARVLLKQNTVSRVLEAGVKRGALVNQQKRKTRRDRLKSNTVDLGDSRKIKSWIFVDDVLVSGGTFKAISASMFTKPKAIFTLFYKPILNNKGFYDA